MNSIQLHSVVEFVRNGATIKQDKNSSLGIPITRIETISNSVFNYDRLGYANVQDDTYSKYYLYDNDVLLSHINSEKFLGRSVLYKLDPAITPIIHGMNLLCIRFHKQVYNPAFFVWYTKSDIAKDYFKIHTKRAVNQASITSTAIKEMPIPDIKIEMQNAIVCELDKIKEALANKNEQLNKLDELIQSKFYEMFGDPLVNDKQWEVMKLGEICEIINGYAFPSSDFSENNPIKTIKITNVGVNKFIEDNSSLPIKYDTKLNYKVHKGDIVIALTRTIISTGLKRALVPQEYDNSLVNQRVAAILVNEINTKKCYVYQYLGTTFVENYVLEKARALMQPNLSIVDLRNMPILVPPLPLQQAFASFVEKVEEAKAIVNQEIAHLQELLDSRMDFYFRK